MSGYQVCVWGGLTTSDARTRTDAAEQIGNAYVLPEAVLRVMGFVPDCSELPVPDDAVVQRRMQGLMSRHQDNQAGFARIVIAGIQAPDTQAVFAQPLTILCQRSS